MASAWPKHSPQREKKNQKVNLGLFCYPRLTDSACLAQGHTPSRTQATGLQPSVIFTARWAATPGFSVSVCPWAAEKTGPQSTNQVLWPQRLLPSHCATWHLGSPQDKEAIVFIIRCWPNLVSRLKKKRTEHDWKAHRSEAPLSKAPFNHLCGL